MRVSVRNAGSAADFEDTRTLAMTISSGSGMAVPPLRGASLLAALHPSHWLMRLFARPAPPVSLTVGRSERWCE